MAAELKPCPFCGEPPDVSFDSVSCSCAAGPFVNCDNSADVWNTRSDGSCGRIIGSRTIQGVHVVVASSFSGLLDDQLLVRYDDYLAATQPPAVGVDVSEEMVERAQIAWMQSDFVNIPGDQDDLEELVRLLLTAALRTGGGE